jgi:hypothetical protein
MLPQVTYLTHPAYAPQPNETFNADANIGHRFAILMANVGALRLRLRRRLTLALALRHCMPTPRQMD